MRTYKVRKFANGKNSRGEPFMNYSLTVPTDTATQLPDDLQFACELLPEIQLPDNDSIPEPYRGRTLQGILFSPQVDRSMPPELPSWARKTNGKPARKPVRRPGA